jgi:hypothetical protein
MQFDRQGGDMRSRFWICALVALLLGGLALSSCGTNPAAQAEPASQVGIVLPTPAPMPTSPPQPPTPTVPPAPIAQPAAANAPLLAADFASSDLGRYSVIDAGIALPGPSVWKVQDGRLIPYSDAQDLPSMYTSALVAGDSAWRDYSVSAAAYATSSDEVGVVARASEAGYYVFKLFPQGQKPAAALLRYDAKRETFVTLASVDAGGFGLRSWSTLRLAVRGQVLTAWVDGREVLSARDATLSAGRAGVAGYPANGLEFDNLTVLPLAAGQP